MSPSSDEPFVRPLTPEEMEQIRRAAKDEKRLLSDTWALLRRVGRKHHTCLTMVLTRIPHVNAGMRLGCPVVSPWSLHVGFT